MTDPEFKGTLRNPGAWLIQTWQILGLKGVLTPTLMRPFSQRGFLHVWERRCCVCPSLNPYQQPWQQQRDPAPPFVARKTFNCPVVIGEKREDPRGGDHCLSNSTGAAGSHLVHSIPKRIGHILGALEKKGGGDTNQPFGIGALPVD